jgi:hypothetical protein
MDIDASVVLTDKHAGTKISNGNEGCTNDGEELVDWIDDDDADMMIGASMATSHSQATDVARSVSPFMLLIGRSHLKDAVSMSVRAQG